MPDDADAAEQSTLVALFGDHPFLHVLDTLLDHPSHDYTKTELAEVNDMSRSTLYRVWDRLEALDLVEETRTIGNTTLYRLNHDSTLAEKIAAFETDLHRDEETRALLGRD